MLIVFIVGKAMPSPQIQKTPALLRWERLVSVLSHLHWVQEKTGFWMKSPNVHLGGAGEKKSNRTKFSSNGFQAKWAMVTPVCSPSAQEAEAGGLLQIQDQTWAT